MTPDRPQKIKLLRLLDLLKRETDVDHPISRQDLCQRLNDMGISSNLRTLSLDIETLNDAGYEVMENQVGHEKYYYVEDRDFSLPELKVLIDAVEAASFISKKRSDELVEKIASLGGEHRADLLKRNMVCFNTRKHSNSHVLFSVDSIEEAICRKKKVAFHYFDLDEKGERVFRTNNVGEPKRYYVEPVALVFNEDNYYLVTYSSRHPDKTANYRVDRMEHVEVVEESVLSDEATAKSTPSLNTQSKHSRCIAASQSEWCWSSKSGSSDPCSISSARKRSCYHRRIISCWQRSMFRSVRHSSGGWRSSDQR